MVKLYIWQHLYFDSFWFLMVIVIILTFLNKLHFISKTDFAYYCWCLNGCGRYSYLILYHQMKVGICLSDTDLDCWYLINDYISDYLVLTFSIQLFKIIVFIFIILEYFYSTFILRWNHWKLLNDALIARFLFLN